MAECATETCWSGVEPGTGSLEVGPRVTSPVEDQVSGGRRSRPVHVPGGAYPRTQGRRRDGDPPTLLSGRAPTGPAVGTLGEEEGPQTDSGSSALGSDFTGTILGETKTTHCSGGYKN